jgi:hypothetical protein
LNRASPCMDFRSGSAADSSMQILKRFLMMSSDVGPAGKTIPGRSNHPSRVCFACNLDCLAESYFRVGISALMAEIDRLTFES